MHILQKYIVPNQQRLQKIRAYWKAKSGLRYLIVSSLSILPKINQNKRKGNKKYLGIYQHKITDFTFAGRLFRSSFDPSLPNRSIILNQLGESMSQKELNDIDPSIGKHFLIRFSETFNNKVTEVQQIDEIREMMNVIIQIINAGISTSQRESVPETFGKEREGTYEGENQMSSELVADFVHDSEGAYYFLQCKSHKLDYIPTKYTSFFPTKTLSSNYFNQADETIFKHSYEPFLTVSSLTNRLKTLEKKSKDFLKEKILPNSLESIDESNKKIYLCNFYNSKLPKVNSCEMQRDKNLSIYSTQINRIAEHYDNVSKSANRNKVETKRRKTLIISESLIDLAVSNIIDKLESHNDLKKIAETAEPFFQQFLVKVLDEDRNLEMFFKLQNNLDWKITNKQFRIIGSIITEESQKAKLFSTSEFKLLNRSIQKLENFIFKHNLNQ